MPTLTCTVCSTSRDARGWKVLAGQTYCPKCKFAHYSLLSVSIPVVTEEVTAGETRPNKFLRKENDI